MKLQKRLKLPLDEVNSGLKFNRVPTASIALASVLAKWFDTIIRARRIIPTLKNEYIFSILKSEFEYNIGKSNIPEGIRNALKNYGYKLRIQGAEVIITKYR